MKPVLALDLDDVLFPFMDQFVPHYNDAYDATFTKDDYHTFDFHEVWGGTAESAYDRVATFFRRSHDGVEPIAGSVEGVELLAEHYDLVVVTARDEGLRPQTEKWIADVFPNRFKHVFLCGTYALGPKALRRSKHEVLTELDAVGLVDDSLHHTKDVAATGRRAMLFGNYAWNRTEVLPDGVHRYDDWPRIIESLVTTA